MRTSIEQESVLRGHVPSAHGCGTSVAKRKVKDITVEEVVMSWRSWTPAQRAAFGKGAGVAEVWDHAIVPTISQEREAVS